MNLLVLFRHRHVDVLIPSKRGDRYLKQPVGHHDNALSKLCRELGVDVCGLDGHLELETGTSVPFDEEGRAAWAARHVKPIADSLRREFRIVHSEEFWEHHPVTGKGC